jgi:hypothetical protein
LWNVSWQAQVAQNRLSRDIETAISITTATSSVCTFLDSDGNSVTYQLSGSSLVRQQNGGTAQALADNISSLSFTYWDANNAITTTVGNIRCIELVTVFNDGLASSNFATSWCLRVA